MAFVVVKGTVRHNGRSYVVGEELPSLKKEEAERLVSLNVVEEQKDKKKEAADK